MNTYQYINGTAAISVNDWLGAGLTYRQFREDSRNGDLAILRRGVGGNTLIAIESIRRTDRKAAIESAFGDTTPADRSLYQVKAEPEARQYYIAYRKDDGTPLSARQIEEYTNRAAILEALKRGREAQVSARMMAGGTLKMKDWYRFALQFYADRREQYPCAAITNARSLERVFKSYLSGGFGSLVSGKLGNDNSRVLSARAKKLILALYAMNGKPFVSEVYRLYTDFVNGDREIYDPESGEVYRPEEFRYKDRRYEVSESTIFRVLKDVVGFTSVYAQRNGNFSYANAMRPKHSRHNGRFSLSKISMDDVALSRKCKKGWVYKYIAVDVVSGYYFKPTYIFGKPTEETVVETFRNMFRELMELGLSMPAELEVEHHLMKNIEDDLKAMFPFVRFCSSPTEKRAEHNIKSLKYGVAHANGHTRGRFYAKSEAYSSVRTKVDGDMVEPEYDYETIVADDLADIMEHNNSPHPRQKTYPGMSRKDVLLSQANPELRPIEPWYLYRYIGEATETSIRNNNHVRCRCRNYELADFNSLDRLQPNNRNVTAYYLPDGEGYMESVYLYQGDTYIGEATDAERWRYNECAVERTAEDEAKMLHQNKRIAQYDRKIRGEREKLPRVGVSPKVLKGVADVEPVIVHVPEQVIGVQPKGYEQDEFSKFSMEEKALQEI